MASLVDTEVYTSPIIFSDAMVYALGTGKKTQTRRIITSQWFNVKMMHELNRPTYLWVREAWAKTSICPIVKTIDHPATVYRVLDATCDYGGPWKPSIHMKRTDSRISLKITDVRKHRLQDISAEDAIAEGVTHDGEPVAAFAALWDRLHGHKEGESWSDNPEIYAFSFEVIKHNIDEVAA